MKYKIVDIHPKDAFYDERHRLIGETMDFVFTEDSDEPGFLWAEASLYVFYAVKLEPAE